MTNQIRLLLVEDDDEDAKMVSIVLDRSPELEIDVDHVISVTDAIERVHENSYDAVLLDLGLPDNWGLNAIGKIKQAIPTTPIIVLTGGDDGDVALAAIRSGAQEYLSKEFVLGQMLTRVLRHSIARQEQLISAQELALVDPLTQVGNRRACDLETDRRLADFERHSTRFCVALFDIDHFKQINDNHGHDIGDQVICGVAQIIKRNTRITDVVSRYGVRNSP